MAISYHIEEADLSTAAAAIQGLWVANLVGHDARSAAAKLRLGYAENPAGTGTAILLYPQGDDRPSGVQGLHPRLFHFGTRRLRAAGLADYAVDEAHRSLGPALMLMRRGSELGAERFDLTYGLPNRKAAAVVARAGLKRIGMVQRYAKPLRSRALLAQRLHQALAAMCAPLVDAALRLQDAALRRIAHSPRVPRFRLERRGARPALGAASWCSAALGSFCGNAALAFRYAGARRLEAVHRERRGWHGAGPRDLAHA